jgi:hypothetical protein
MNTNEVHAFSESDLALTWVKEQLLSISGPLETLPLKRIVELVTSHHDHVINVSYDLRTPDTELTANLLPLAEIKLQLSLTTDGSQNYRLNGSQFLLPQLENAAFEKALADAKLSAERIINNKYTDTDQQIEMLMALFNRLFNTVVGKILERKATQSISKGENIYSENTT